jgi:hypothetical protein
MLSLALLHVFRVVLPLQAASYCQRRLGNAHHAIHLFELAFVISFALLEAYIVPLIGWQVKMFCLCYG